MTSKVQDFKRPEIVKAAYAVVAHRAIAAIERRAVNEIYEKLLQGIELYTSVRWEPEQPRERITSHENLFLADAQDLEPYWVARRAAIAEAGYVVEGDQCPALLAELKATEAQWALIDAVRINGGDQFAGITVDRLLCAGLDKYKAFIELVLKLAIGQDQQAKAGKLFIGVMPAGISYCDRTQIEDGDYKRIAFLDYETLTLKIYDSQSSLLGMVKADAAKVQAMRGERYQVSASGQTVVLGGASC